MYNSQLVTERIKQVTKEKNVSMSQLNEICGLSKNAISSAGKSQEGMKAKNLYMIAEYLDVSVDYLLGRTDTPNGTSIKAGNINGNNNSLTDSNNININNKKSPDSISEKFMAIFNNLPFEEQLEIMNIAVDKSKNKE